MASSSSPSSSSSYPLYSASSSPSCSCLSSPSSSRRASISKAFSKPLSPNQLQDDQLVTYKQMKDHAQQSIKASITVQPTKEEKLHQDLICSICTSIAWQPVQTECDHIFCKQCLDDWMRATKSENGEQAKCPMDRKAIDLTMVKPLKEINPLGWKMIGRIEVKCPRYESLGCDWIGEYSDAYDHVHHKCAYSLDLCQWCLSSFQRRHLDQHESDDCSERPIVCSYCEESMPFEDMDDHIQHDCSKVSVQCTGDKESEVVLDGAVTPSVVMSSPSTGCGEIMVRSSYQLHLRDECPATLIPCSYARHGCNVGLIKRGSMSNHLNSNMSQHLELVTATLAKTNNKLDSVVSALLDWVKESTPSSKQALLNIFNHRPTNPSSKFEFDPPISFSFIEPWHLEFILYMHEEAANRKLRKLPPPPLSPFHSQTSPTIHARKEFLSSLQAGAKFDARDKEGRWLKAEVVRKADQPPSSVYPWLKVHFSGFHTRWDEWIHLEHSVDRIAPLHYFTSHSNRSRSSSSFTHQHASVLVYHWSATASERSWRRGTVVEVEATGEQAKVSYHIDSTPFMRWYHKQANEIILLE